MGTTTPWGTADSSEKIARGIMSYSTPGHGGIHLSPTRQREMPEALKVESGWYEEDCDWCLVAIAYPDYFTEHYQIAVDTFRNWHPERYEKYYGVILKPEESYLKRRNMEDNKEAN